MKEAEGVVFRGHYKKVFWVLVTWRWEVTLWRTVSRAASRAGSRLQLPRFPIYADPEKLLSSKLQHGENRPLPDG